jgi:hypothetical protein
MKITTSKFTTQFIAACAGSMTVTASFAHEGHGLTGMHWHATDTWGFVTVAAMIAVAVWLSRK